MTKAKAKDAASLADERPARLWPAHTGGRRLFTTYQPTGVEILENFTELPSAQPGGRADRSSRERMLSPVGVDHDSKDSGHLGRRNGADGHALTVVQDDPSINKDSVLFMIL